MKTADEVEFLIAYAGAMTMASGLLVLAPLLLRKSCQYNHTSGAFEASSRAERLP